MCNGFIPKILQSKQKNHPDILAIARIIGGKKATQNPTLHMPRKVGF